MTSPYATGRFARAIGIDTVTDHTSAADIVTQMLTDLQEHPNEWENDTLDRFLKALAASLDALPQLYSNRGEQFPSAPTWKMIAEALIMASGYE